MKKIICSVLAFLMVLAVLISCSNGGDNTKDTKKVDGATTEAQGTEDEFEDNVPELKYDGATFMVAGPWPSGETVFIQEEDSDNPVDAAKWRRNKLLEERFDIKIDGVELGETGAQVNAFSQYASSGDDVISVIGVAFYQSGAGMITAGYALPWNDVNYINLDKPWWDKQLTDSMSILGNYYFLSGDFNYGRYTVTMAMFFNKKVASDYSDLVGDLYQTVRDKEWTQERLLNYVKAYSHDDGDSVLDENDYYGLIQNTNTLSSYVYGANVYTAKCTDDGFEVNIVTEKMNKIVEYARSLINDENLCWAAEGTIDSSKIFFADHALFMQSDLALVESWREYDSDFGILPLPMYDEAQDNYYTYSDQWGLGLMLPCTVVDRDMVGAVLEAASALSRKLVVPAYYDVQLSTKLTRDDESKEMLDIIFKNFIYDPGIIYAGDLNFIPMTGCIKEDKALATWYASRQRMLNMNLKTLFEYVENNK